MHNTLINFPVMLFLIIISTVNKQKKSISFKKKITIKSYFSSAENEINE